MRRIIFILLAAVLAFGCGMPKETRRGVGNEGFLIIQAEPDDADVYVDGQKMGEAGKFSSDPLELSGGAHRIEFRRSGYVSEMRDVYVGNQSRHTLKINLRKSQ